jgi:predicted nucleic acid-binding protein
MMLVDTDVLVWNLRRNLRAAEALDTQPGFAVSSVTYMELVQGLQSKAEFRQVRKALGF